MIDEDGVVLPLHDLEPREEGRVEQGGGHLADAAAVDVLQLARPDDAGRQLVPALRQCAARPACRSRRSRPGARSTLLANCVVILTLVWRSGVPFHTVWKSPSLSLMPMALASSVVSSGCLSGDRHFRGAVVVIEGGSVERFHRLLADRASCPGRPGTTQALVPSPLKRGVHRVWS